MVRGSTPTFTFSLPFGTDSLSSLTVCFVQDGKEVLSFGLERMILDGKEISFTLSEEETLSFVYGIHAEIQLRAVTSNGEILISDIRKTPIRRKYPDDAQ